MNKLPVRLTPDEISDSFRWQWTDLIPKAHRPAPHPDGKRVAIAMFGDGSMGTLTVPWRKKLGIDMEAITVLYNLGRRRLALDHEAECQGLPPIKDAEDSLCVYRIPSVWGLHTHRQAGK
jgi:hypothetical protein